MKKHKFFIISAIFAILTVSFLLFPFSAKTRSLLAMYFYDQKCEKESVPVKNGLHVMLPIDHMDFYPLLVTFNEDRGMSSWLEKEVQFTVEYTFGDFETLKSYSQIYDEDSDYYSAYVGIYYIKGLQGPLTSSDAFKVADFDVTELALPAIGLDSADSVFEKKEDLQSEIISLSGLSWNCYNTTLTTNAASHNLSHFHQGYLQFGFPPSAGLNYPVIEMSARFCTTYIREKDINIALYAIAKSPSVLSKIDSQILSKTEISY